MIRTLPLMFLNFVELKTYTSTSQRGKSKFSDFILQD